MTHPDMQTLVHALSEVQRDALREVANIGAGHAATALSLMTDTRIMVSVPTITVAPLKDLAPMVAATEAQIAVIPMEMRGSLDGHTILVFPLSTAHRLAALMLHRATVDADDLTALEASALTEAGNILAGAYMTALSEFLRMTLLPSPPSLIVGNAQQVLAETAEQSGHKHGYVVCVETQFVIDDIGEFLPGYFLLLPDARSLGAMLAAIHVA